MSPYKIQGQVSSKSTEEYYPEVVFVAVVGVRPIKLQSEERSGKNTSAGFAAVW